jgi:hypothetical protein
MYINRCYLFKYFQKELPIKHESDHEGILNKAFAIKYNQRKMKKLEKDFSIIKKEEQEEQVEMRVIEFNFFSFKFYAHIYVCFQFLKRLRAENKLLKQRIDNLEKVCLQFLYLYHFSFSSYLLYQSTFF